MLLPAFHSLRDTARGDPGASDVEISTAIILIHQVLFQGLFLAKNMTLQRRLGTPVRGVNREATLAIGFFALFIIVAGILSLNHPAVWSFQIMPEMAARAVAIALITINLVLGTAALIGLKDSWRVGVLEQQRTALIQSGIYRFSRNPYFLSYLTMFAAYTVLLQNVVLLILSFAGFAMIHKMILKEEQYLLSVHGERYLRYKDKVPRYFIL